MSKFNAKVKPEMAINEMGEKAFVMKPEEDLVSTVLTTFLSDSYYEKEKDIVERIKEQAEKCDPLFVAKLAIYARTEANMRSSSHLLASILPARISGKDWAKNFYEKIVVRPDDISEILSAYYINNEHLPHAMLKGFKKAFEKFDIYQLDKYKMKNKTISLVDLMNLLHPKPNQRTSKAYKDLIENGGKNLSTMHESKILEKEMSEAGKKESDLNENKAEAIRIIFGDVKKMPIMNLIRNLRNIMKYAPDKIADACLVLNNPTRVKGSKLLPFRFATAYAEIEKLNYNDNNEVISFESDKTYKMTEKDFIKKKTMLLDSLEKALNYACQNIPEFEGNTAILVDASGSMTGDAGGSSRVSAFSKTTTSSIAILFGCMLAKYQKNIYMALFNDKLIPIIFNRDKGILENQKEARELIRISDGGTENGLYIFLEECIKTKKKVDNLIIFSDMVIGNDYRGWDYTSRYPKTFQELFKEFRKLNPECHVVCVNLCSTSGKSVFNKSTGVTEIAGWSDKIFDIIDTAFAGYKKIIDEINAIQI